MDITVLITYAVAGLSSLLIIGSAFFMWKSALAFNVNTQARGRAILYSLLATFFSILILWLIINWLSQFLNPNMTGHPGPFALITFIIAAVIGTTPNIVGYAFMASKHERNKI